MLQTLLVRVSEDPALWPVTCLDFLRLDLLLDPAIYPIGLRGRTIPWTLKLQIILHQPQEGLACNIIMVHSTRQSIKASGVGLTLLIGHVVGIPDRHSSDLFPTTFDLLHLSSQVFPILTFAPLTMRKLKNADRCTELHPRKLIITKK
jgi:hypothetical protein